MARSPLKRAAKPLLPLLGAWTYSGDSPLGPLTCQRTFTPILDGNWVQLDAVWTYKDPKRGDYVERCLFGLNAEKSLSFHSFINDGSSSYGIEADGSDISANALCFEAQMPHGLARQTYWPGENGSLNWRVERQVKSGWSELVGHVYEVV